MKNQDWYFSGEDYICGFRAVGVLVQDGKILVQREKDGDEYALPGGCVRVGETGTEAVVREYREETGADILCGRMIWVEETFWKWRGKDAHTLSFYYLISLKDETAIPDTGEFFSQKDNCNVVLGWLPIAGLAGITVYPTVLSQKIGALAEGIEHFVYREEA